MGMAAPMAPLIDLSEGSPRCPTAARRRRPGADPLKLCVNGMSWRATGMKSSVERFGRHFSRSIQASEKHTKSTDWTAMNHTGTLGELRAALAANARAQCPMNIIAPDAMSRM